MPAENTRSTGADRRTTGDCHDAAQRNRAPEAKVSAAVDLLREHNIWRRGGDGPQTDPTALGIAIDVVVNALSAHQPPSGGEVSEVTRQLIERDAAGRKKYGTTLDRTDLSLADWLQHMAEELLDAAGYALAAKRTTPPSEQVGVDRVLIDRGLAERLADAIGRFTGDEGWGVADMRTADDFAAALAQQPAAVTHPTGAAVSNAYARDGGQPNG